MAAFESCGVSPEQLAHAARDTETALPWDHLSSGVSRRYLVRERERAYSVVPTTDCSFEGCTGCDACSDLGVDIVLGGGQRR